jgi:hypothetical protein
LFQCGRTDGQTHDEANNRFSQLANAPERLNFVIDARNYDKSGFGGLEDACWRLVPKFVGSNPVEAVGFLRAKKSAARLPSEGK